MRSPLGLAMLLGVVACGGGGDPMTGTAKGDFGGGPFVPRYGVAYGLPAGQLLHDTFAVELSDAPDDCAHSLGGAHPGVPAPGIYAELDLTDSSLTPHSGVDVTLSRVVDQNHVIYVSLAELSNGAQVTLTAASDTRVEGSVAYSSTATDADGGTQSVDLNGTFSVQRCP